VQGVLIALQYGKLHALVSPEAVESRKTLLRHTILDTNFGIGGDEFGETLS